MRIIGGRYKGKRLTAPSNLPVRPTTDFAKESLFNILRNEVNFEKLRVLDLFSGTGNISFEIASRGCEDITALDLNFNCVRFIKKTSAELDFPIKTLRHDVMRFLKKPPGMGYDLIFADPPYQLQDLDKLPDLILENQWLNAEGLFILEHGDENNFSGHERLTDQRKYGHVHFSFFE